MYANRIPFTRDAHKGPKADKPAPKKASKPVVEESAIAEPAKIEVEPIDLITEVESDEPAEETNGNA